MTGFDFSPLFRSTIGFDRLTRLADAAARLDGASLSYPPYNIAATDENAYRVTMAVAGFGSDDLEITLKENELLVAGNAVFGQGHAERDARSLLEAAQRAARSAAA
jgi:molecular chaperone IbpA